MKQKMLITGASGFIGSFLVEEALAKGYEVFAAIRKSSNKTYLQQNELHLIELNLSSKEILANQLRNFAQEHGSFDYVIHNAGLTQAKRVKDFFDVNFQCTKNLVEALIDCGMSIKKFVLTSSLAAYGPGETKNFTPIKTGDKQEPVTAYGKSKLAAEQYVQTQSLPYIIINPTAVYGPRDKDFLQFVKLINKGFEPYIGRNKQMVSMIYAKDLASVIIASAALGFSNRSYIVSDGKGYNKDELGQTIKNILDKKTFVIKLPAAPIYFIIGVIETIYKIFGTLPFLNTEKVAEISSANWLCDSQDIWNDLQTEPHYLLDNGMKETVEWYQQNKWL